MSRDAAYWIRALGLKPHPEGGHYRETWRSDEAAEAAALPARFGGPRALGTAIYYLLPAGEISRVHRLRADEVWHLYEGGPLRLHLLDPVRGHEEIVLGRDMERGESLQAVVPHGTWFGAETGPDAAFALVGCTVAPGFDFQDFELGSRRTLLAECPAQREWIMRLTAAGE